MVCMCDVTVITQCEQKPDDQILERLENEVKKKNGDRCEAVLPCKDSVYERYVHTVVQAVEVPSSRWCGCKG